MSKHTAEPFDCVFCGRRIGARKTHYITETNKVVGPCCRFGSKSTVPAHAQLFPDCPVEWHGLGDHTFLESPRAGTHWWLSEDRTSTASWWPENWRFSDD